MKAGSVGHDVRSDRPPDRLCAPRDPAVPEADHRGTGQNGGRSRPPFLRRQRNQMPGRESRRRYHPAIPSVIGKCNAWKSAPESLLGDRIHRSDGERRREESGRCRPHFGDQLNPYSAGRGQCQRGKCQRFGVGQSAGPPGEQLRDAPRAQKRDGRGQADCPVRREPGDIPAPRSKESDGEAEHGSHRGRHPERKQPRDRLHSVARAAAACAAAERRPSSAASASSS